MCIGPYLEVLGFADLWGGVYFVSDEANLVLVGLFLEGLSPFRQSGAFFFFFFFFKRYMVVGVRLRAG